MELDYYDGSRESEVPIEDLRPVLPVFVPPARVVEAGRRVKRLLKQRETAVFYWFLALFVGFTCFDHASI